MFPSLRTVCIKRCLSHCYSSAPQEPLRLFPSRPLDAALLEALPDTRPKIGVAVSCTIGLRNGFPQTAADLFTAISHSICHDLSRLSTQGDPDPRVIGLFEHKRSEFIHFQDGRLCIVRIRRDQRFAQGWQLCGLFLSRRSPRSVTPHMFALALANCFVLRRL